MSSEVIITDIKQSSISIEDVFKLVHSSFRQWKENGLDSAVYNYTLEDYLKGIDKACVLVAFNKDGRLLGTYTLEFRQSYCFGKYLAVAPDAKRCGLGRLLYEKECELAKEKGCEYLLHDTAQKAIWSVNWHLKLGFKIIGYQSFSTNNYYSYVFRKQLVPSKKWDNDAYCKSQFIKSWFRTILTKDRFGRPTLLGRMAASLMR